MRILQVHNRYRIPGGEDVVVESEAEQLRDGGHEVHQYSTTNPVGRLGAVRDLALSPWNPLRAREVAAVARRIRPDVVHVHNTWFHLSPAVFAAARSSGAAVVATLHNYRAVCASYTLLRDGSPCERCVDERSVRSALRYGCYGGSRVLTAAPAATIALSRRRGTWHSDVDAVVVLTDFARDVFERAGLPDDRLVVKPNFAADPGPRPASPSASRRVLFVGRLAEEKGVRQLLQAWRDAGPSGLTLEVAGDGPLRELVEREPNVVSLGWISPDQTRELMLNSRTLVFPSQWYEGLSLTMVEAMAAGLPVLSTQLGSMQSVLGADHELFSGPRAVDIAGRLELLEDDQLIDRVSRRQRERYETLYTPAATLRALERVYESAIQRRAAAST
jgi:glycosyltransferase involved in cell wall biosynthesis